VRGLSFLHLGAVRPALDFDTEEIRSLSLVEDEENLGYAAISVDGLEDYDMVDLRLEKGPFGLGHDLAAGRSGARKLTVERSTTSSR